MAYYEHVYIARQDIAPAQVEALTQSLEQIVQENGGKVTKQEYWGLRTMQYKIKKNRKGHYTLLNIDAPSDAVIEMERQMRINEDILRFMTLRVDELSDEPSPVLSRKDSSGSRGKDRD
ncbi:MAG: 30S ribosomal protein S6 [Aquisalinus sp.]|nr:30S ribosomal protein S6 [Aquisalinus sp.]